jgi:hypothetical protein
MPATSSKVTREYSFVTNLAWLRPKLRALEPSPCIRRIIPYHNNKTMKNGSSESRAVKIHDESLAPSMLRETPFGSALGRAGR